MTSLTIARVTEIRRQTERQRAGSVPFAYPELTCAELLELCAAWLDLETRVKCAETEHDTTLCHCGKPLHYAHPGVEAFMRNLVAEAGPFVLMSVGGGTRTYRVPRHFIALHGVEAAKMDTYGFEVVNDEHDGEET
jgi:hypothetical protein